ncbi:MAG: alanine--tRNA ligase [Patescibacteria group bacterium]
MTLDQLRDKFLSYFQGRGYIRLPAASVVPDNDPSVLFTTAGMQQFKPFYTQPELTKHHAIVNIQPVIRTTDIAEVGDATHLTSFEMLGNFRFGANNIYELKEKAIDEAWEFISQELKVEKDRVYATVFEGDAETPADEDSEKIWRIHGVKVVKANRADNFWGPTGDEGPCGPNTEIYIDGIEVWNLVFNQFYRDRDGAYSPLEFVGLDTGSGLERLAATLQGKKSVWEIEPFKGWAEHVNPENLHESRIIIDHLRAIIFIASAGIEPSNKAQGYVLRRLIRKAAFMAERLSGGFDWGVTISHIHSYYAQHQALGSPEAISELVTKERAAFQKNLVRATNHLERWLEKTADKDEKAVTELAFYMFESFGFPKELVLEQLIRLGYLVDLGHFEKLFAKHQEISRAGTGGQFKGGLADHNEQTIKHHTAHHLLLAALREVLGSDVHQRGSNVTSERLRIDFSFDRKVTDDELKKVERIVNEKIKATLPVTREEMSQKAALKSGALAEFGQKYGEIVAVYSIGDFSKELCGGPHVKTTGELGKFKILKEEASSQGVRRIKARVG